MPYDKLTLTKQAKTLGFQRDTLEKALRLVDILKFFETDPLLSNRLALKGGTAINLVMFNLPRLSVDIDLDYAINNPKDQMMTERDQITSILKKHMAMQGYVLNEKSKFTYALDSFVFVYTNSAGMRDNIKVEINYSLRCHVLPFTRCRVTALGGLGEVQVLSVAPLEIFASKIVALLSRTAARDLYDINNILSHQVFGEAEQEVIRKCVVFYLAISGNMNLEVLDIDRIYSLTTHKISTELQPVLRKKEAFDLEAAQARVKAYLAELLVLTSDEQKFLDSFRNDVYCPESVFDGEILERINSHPMARWRTRVEQESAFGTNGQRSII